MADPNSTRISPARLALAVKRLRAEKEDLELLHSDPIAIIGMGCRFPAESHSLEAFWETLIEGRSGAVKVPEGRWQDKAGLQPEQCIGGYLDNIDAFDAEYFGISPREAHQIDPQQRLLLEVTWEALWDAGIEPATLAGSDTGVFVSIYNSDYARLHYRNPSALTAYSGFGTAHSIASGRIAFLLDLKGPNTAVDSACSSSLVATHIAVQSLRARECNMAIVGASSLKSLPDEVLVLAKWGMLAHDGKSKAFDAAADGFGPGEGTAAVVLKRLSDALQDGDRIRAVIRGSAVNHDGRSTVLTAPNGLSQQAVIRTALKNARIEPHEISFVEAHGTGTSLGDPIEVEALNAVYGGANVDASPCVLGAVKTNLGHLEAAAGLAGLIKTVLVLENGIIPKNLHFHKLNPQILLEDSRLSIAAEPVSWPRGTRPRVAGISSFGLGGTNAHLIVEEAPLLPVNQHPEKGRTIPLPKRQWTRQRLWLSESASRSTHIVAANTRDGYVHPLLGRLVSSGFINGSLFESELDPTSPSYLKDHSLGGQPLLPFAAFLEIANAAASHSRSGTAFAIHNFTLQEPLFVSSPSRKLQVLVTGDSVEIASERGSEWVRHAKGTLHDVPASTGSVDLSKLRSRCQQAINQTDIYRQLEAAGLRFGPGFRVIQQAWRGAGESLALLRLPSEMHQAAAKYGMHPTLLDGCLQTVIAARDAESSDLFLPIALDEFHLHRRGETELWVHCRMTRASADSMTAEIAAFDSAGAPVASLSGFHVKRTSISSVNRAIAVEAPAYELAWRPQALPMKSEPVRNGERWLLVEGESGSCAKMAEALTRQGAICKIVDQEKGPQALEDHAWTAILYDARSTAVLCTDGRWQHPEKSSIEFVLAFAKALLAGGDAAAARLWVTVSSAFAVLSDESPSLAQAPLLGMLRTLAVEHATSAPVLMDTAAGGPLETGDDWILREIAAGGDDPIVAFRAGVRHVARLVLRAPQSEEPRRLAIDVPGRLDDLTFQSISRRAPEPHEVEIEVRTTGLNFRDVLTALGVFGGRDPRFGGECAGTVVRVGSAVRGFVPGQNVLAFAPRSFQSYINIPEAYAAPMPAGMTFADAASIPIAFLTAYYGLHTLAGMSSGQRVLIHAAAGGLGQAAVQLAQQAGAQIYATAGSEAKRDFLRTLGIRHIFDSRSLTFRSEVLKATDGAGVDIVLNSLADDFVRAGLETVASNGCFLEVGKRGIWTPKQVADFRQDIRYFPFDLGEVAQQTPALIGDLLQAVMPHFVAGRLQPIRTTLYPLDNAAQAFRTMAQGGHVGKIVLAHGPRQRECIREIVANGTVLVTGGLGALGGATAGWLASKGAKSLVLASRQAKDDDPVVVDLRKSGVDVCVEQIDMASSEQAMKLLDRIRSTRPPLTAIFHAAGVLEDAVLGREEWSHYTRSTAAKLEGAWNLHRLTQSDPLKLMVFFSSAASILGSAGQGSYAASNAFLDALAHFRTARGMQTLSVNWGAWASGGMAARLSAEHRARWERQGVRPMENAAALSALETAIEGQCAQVSVMDLDWQRFLSNRVSHDIALFQELSRREKAERVAAVGEDPVLQQILSASTPVREQLMSLHIKECARRVLSLDAGASIHDQVPLQDIGLDSLMALEMRNELMQSLGLTLSAGLLFNYPTVQELTEHLLGLLPVTTTPSVETTVGGNDDLAALDAMTDEEAEQLLLEELNGSGRKAHV